MLFPSHGVVLKLCSYYSCPATGDRTCMREISTSVSVPREERKEKGEKVKRRDGGGGEIERKPLNGVSGWCTRN